jgi:hypothetical protein
MALPSRRTVLIALAIVLVTVPLWAPALDVTGQDYEYRAAPVTVEDNRIGVPELPVQLTGVETIDCFHEIRPSRRCVFEASLLDDGSVQATHPNIPSLSMDPSLSARERYVAFPSDGRVFERTTDWNASARAYVLELRRANASRVLADAAQRVGYYDRPLREAVATGSARASYPLPEPTLVSSNGRYYVVYTAGPRTFLPERPVTERVLSAGAVFGGVLILRRVWDGG